LDIANNIIQLLDFFNLKQLIQTPSWSP